MRKNGVKSKNKMIFRIFALVHFGLFLQIEQRGNKIGTTVVIFFGRSGNSPKRLFAFTFHCGQGRTAFEIIGS